MKRERGPNGPEQEQDPEVLEAAKALDERAGEIADQIESTDLEKLSDLKKDRINGKMEIVVYALFVCGGAMVMSHQISNTFNKPDEVFDFIGHFSFGMSIAGIGLRRLVKAFERLKETSKRIERGEYLHE